MSRPGLEPGPLDPETSALTMSPPRLPTSWRLLASKPTYHTARRTSAQSSKKTKHQFRWRNEVEWRRHHVAFIKIRHPHPGSREFPLNICVVLWEQAKHWIKNRPSKSKTLPNLKNLKLGNLFWCAVFITFKVLKNAHFHFSLLGRASCA